LGEEAEPGGLTEEQQKALNERKQKKKQEKKEKVKALKAQRKAMIEKRAAALGVKPKPPQPKQPSKKEGTTAAEEKAEKAKETKEEEEEELEQHAISDEELAALQDPERPAKRTELLRGRKARPPEVMVDAAELREAPPVPPHIARIIARNQQAARGGAGTPPSSGQGS
jgi:hypothetical protein